MNEWKHNCLKACTHELSKWNKRMNITMNEIVKKRKMNECMSTWMIRKNQWINDELTHTVWIESAVDGGAKAFVLFSSGHSRPSSTHSTTAISVTWEGEGRRKKGRERERKKERERSVKSKVSSAEQNKQCGTSEWVNGASKWTREWLSIYAPILGWSEPLCFGKW